MKPYTRDGAPRGLLVAPVAMGQKGDSICVRELPRNSRNASVAQVASNAELGSLCVREKPRNELMFKFRTWQRWHCGA